MIEALVVLGTSGCWSIGTFKSFHTPDKVKDPHTRKHHPKKADQPPADIGKDPAAEERWRQKNEVFKAFRGTDDANAFTGKIDLFFGGGSYDHSSAFQQGLTVPPWAADGAPPDTLTAADGGVLVPERFGRRPVGQQASRGSWQTFGHAGR